MDAAERLAPDETETLQWAEICARYPDQYVCLVDMETAAPRSPVITSARVVGNGPTRRAAFDPIRSLGGTHPLLSVRFTGISTRPLLRPMIILDDETRDAIRSRR